MRLYDLQLGNDCPAGYDSNVPAGFTCGMVRVFMYLLHRWGLRFRVVIGQPCVKSTWLSRKLPDVVYEAVGLRLFCLDATIVDVLLTVDAQETSDLLG
jgi:hypothetical protein